MGDNAKNTRVNLIPTMRYDDAPAAIEWLFEAFGFEKLLVVPAEKGGIAHLSSGDTSALEGPQLETDWALIVGWQRAFWGYEASVKTVLPDAGAKAVYPRP